jgi:hypothetical protein
MTRSSDSVEKPTGKRLESKLVLLAPSYDRLTEAMRLWLEELATRAVSCISGDGVRRESVQNLILQHERLIIIFGGHGTPDALLGPPVPPNTLSIRNTKHSKIYDKSLASLGPSCLLAVCCSAAADLGSTIKAFDRSFLGYKRDIPFHLCDEGCSEIWKSIVQTVARRVIEDGNVSKTHSNVLTTLYEEAIGSFRSGGRRTHKHKLFMEMYLLRHLRTVSYQGVY